MSARTPQADASGVALLEVLIALTIVAIVIGGFASIATVSIDSANDGRDKMLANWIALNDITELRLEPGLPSEGTSSDTIEFSGAMWRIEREIEQTPVENILRVDVNVYRDESGDETSLVFLSGFLGPRAPAELALPDWASYTPAQQTGQAGTDSGQQRPVNEGRRR